MLLTEGGLAGHIYHIYEDPNISFFAIKDIIVKTGNGELQGTEKVDGINGYFTYSLSEGVCKIVRNKTQLSGGGVTKDQIYQKYVDSDKEIIGKVFKSATDAFEQFCKSLDKQSIIELFGKNGEKYYNCEIVNSELPNIIHYDGNKIIFHLTGHIYLINGVAKQHNFTEELEYLRNITDEYPSSSYNFLVNKVIKINAIEDKSIIRTTIDKLNEEMQRSQIDDEDSIKDYIFSRKEDGFDDRRSQLQPLEQIITDFAQTLLSGYASQFVGDHKAEQERLSALNPENPNILTTSEGFVFEYQGKTYKLTGSFAPLTRYENDKRKMNEIKENPLKLMFFPGSFKPPHKGHFDLVMRYINKVDKMFILISAKPRSVKQTIIDANLSKYIWEKYLEKAGVLGKVQLIITEISPVIKCYDYINTQVPQGSHVYLLMSSKDKAEDRFGMRAERDDIKIKVISKTPTDGLNSNDFRNAIDSSNIEEMTKFIPDIIKHKDLFSDHIIQTAKQTEEIPKSINEELENFITSVLTETIRKKGNKYCLFSKKSNRNLGCYPSKSGAKNREKQVQYFKHLKEEGAAANSLAAGGVQFPVMPANVKKRNKNVTRRKDS
jgi:hypothetical protein